MYYVSDRFCFSVVNGATIYIRELNSLQSIKEKLQKHGFTSCISSTESAYTVEYYLDLPAKPDNRIPKLRKNDKLIVFQIPPREEPYSREELNKLMSQDKVKIFEIAVS